MATFLKATGNATISSEFKYNTIYNKDNTVKKDLDPTGKGDRAFIYNEFIATQFRDAKIKDQGIGSIFGLAEASRSATPVGGVTEEGAFSYNGGVTSETNIPSFFTDTNAEEEIKRANIAYTINKNSVLERRNSNDEDNTDGVLDDEVQEPPKI